MRFDDIKHKIVRGLDESMPDLLDAIKQADPGELPDLPDLSGEQPEAVKRRRPLWQNRWLQSAVACALLLVAGLSVLFFPRDTSVACVEVDIGTSCQLYLDQGLNVTKVVSTSQSMELPQLCISDALKLVSYETYIDDNSFCIQSSVPSFFFAVSDGRYSPEIRDQILTFCQERGIKESDVCMILLSEHSVEQAKALNISPIRYELMQVVLKKSRTYSARDLLKLSSSQLYAIVLQEEGRSPISSNGTVIA